MKNYYRIMLGRKSVFAADAFAGGFIGADFGITEDLSRNLPDEWKAFNAAFIPLYLERNPAKTRIGAGLAMGMLWTVCKGLNIGDIVLCPDGSGRYRVGEVTGEYQHSPAGPLPHRRPVRWLEKLIERSDMSESLQGSTGSIGTISKVTQHAQEIERLVGGITAAPGVVATTPEIEDPSAFVLEKHLEDFLVENWHQTELGREYDIYQEDGELVGQQYDTDTGPVDVLAISKDKKRLLVVELKKGRASDTVVGQTLRYTGYVSDELAEEDQEVRGVIIAAEDDPRLRRALSMTPSIQFFKYQVIFRLLKA